ncbi:restriction endonuclease subunit S [Myroides odoratimimus]|nr:restriction endonuclease subunit S [Myroides odoratimimus]MDM1471043.1 restriction endonuclease subunit S [Myroides odoratimimus]
MRFPGFEGEWETKTLGEISQLITKGTTPKKFTNQGIKYIKIESFKENSIDIEKCMFIDEITHNKELKRSILREGDILFAIAGATIGKTNIVTKAVLPANTNQALAIIRLNEKEVKSYIIQILKSAIMQKYIKESISVGAQPNLNLEQINSFSFCYPNIEEQKKIASFLSLINERIITQNKIIEELEQLIKGLCQKLFHNRNNKDWSEQSIEDVLEERKEVNTDNYTVHSVSVSKGVINQIEYLGRSFAAKDTKNYNVVHYGDIVYTKSPTGEFPYGIIKQSFIKERVAVSPLYGVFRAKSFYMANILHFYFSNPINVQNYLQSIIQKGAKNTISITNQSFLKKRLYLPIDEKEIKKISSLLSAIESKKTVEMNILERLKNQKKHFLQQMFI